MRTNKHRSEAQGLVERATRVPEDTGGTDEQLVNVGLAVAHALLAIHDELDVIKNAAIDIAGTLKIGSR